MPAVTCICPSHKLHLVGMILRLDFTYSSNNWGVGLPPKEKNEKSWPL